MSLEDLDTTEVTNTHIYRVPMIFFFLMIECWQWKGV